MDTESVKAIALQGIVHNATKIGVQDGQCEDLVNLRFKDGSWRTSGDGKHLFSMNYQSDVPNTSGISYTQLFIHTNIYRHLLGVCNDKLYWFGNIDADGVFESLSSPKELVTVDNDLYICQTGHLLTIIDGSNFTYLLFKSSNDNYITLNVDLNGSQDSRMLYPFGQIHFNYADAGKEGIINEDKKGEDGWDIWGKQNDWGKAGKEIYIRGKNFGELSGGGVETLHNTMVKMYGEILEKNYFTDPFLVCAAIKLYDGKYMYASAPAMIFPRQRAYNTDSRYVHKEATDKLNEGYDEIKSQGICSHNGALLIPSKIVDGKDIYLPPNSGVKGKVIGGIAHIPVDLTDETGEKHDNYRTEHARQGGEDVFGVFRNGIYAHTYCAPAGQGVFITDTYSLSGQSSWKFQIRGCNLCVSIDNTLLQVMNDNKDLFRSLCIFVTPQSSIYKMDIKDKGYCRRTLDTITHQAQIITSGLGTTITQDLRCSVANMSYMPYRRDYKDIRYDLLHSQFYLLREYSQDELPNLLKNPIVDLQDPKYEGILKNITQQDTLKVEAVSRYSYIPKVQYTYNGRLHIADYIRSQFHGYPIDTFHLNNHSLKYDAKLDNFRWFKGSLSYLMSFYDDTLSEKRTDHFLTRYAGTQLMEEVKKAGDVSAYIDVEIETNDGVQKVCRYIPFVTPQRNINGYADFVETLDTLLTFPDSRAKKMVISILENTDGTTMTLYKKEFKLEAHPYLNISYYMDENLKPTLLDKVVTKSVTEYQTDIKPSFNKAPQEVNTAENYANGLKVSATNNPLYFPVENTYQVGSAEIVAMMSNSIAVGTGQTGSAPLYIFCKDGVYAMFVDSTGETTYTNSRIIARDVCNNQRSVTPIDTGVVFTTDRGLMQIAGEQVAEIGQPMEGDWVKYTTQGSVDFSKIAKNAYYMKRIAALPDETTPAEDSMTKVDFLEYLKGSIVNYNHNERELMVSNPAYHYTYILDREGNWSRRDIRAEQYVNNYPTSYRVEKGELYQVDKESDADNGFFAMSHVVKLDSIGFKELHRLVARGYFETISKKEYKTIAIPEGKKVITLSATDAILAAWDREALSATYTRTIYEDLYHLNVQESPFERELVISNPTPQIIYLKCDGCTINTDAENNVTIIYQLTDDYGNVIDYVEFETDDITETYISIRVQDFLYNWDLETGKSYHLVMYVKGEVYLKNGTKDISTELNFERYIEGDQGPSLTTELVKKSEVGICGYNMKTAEEDIRFNYGTTISDVRNFLEIPVNNVGILKIKSGDRKIIISTNDVDDSKHSTIIQSLKIGDQDESMIEQPAFEFQLINEQDEVVYSLHLHDSGDRDNLKTYNITENGISSTYTIYQNLHLYILGDESSIVLSEGKYRQRIVSSGMITTVAETTFAGGEFDVEYNCKVIGDVDIIDTASYTNDAPINNLLSSTKLDDNGETDALYGIDTKVILGIIPNRVSDLIQYNSDSAGNITSFTIPENMFSQLLLSFDGGSNISVEGHNKNDEILNIGDIDGSVGNAILCICDANGETIWSYRMNGSYYKDDKAGILYNMDDEDSKKVIELNIPAGTYHTEVRLQNIKFPVDEGYDHYADFVFKLGMQINASLLTGRTSNIYKMSSLILPRISQSISQTIPAHTEQVIDPDKTYDTILGLYVFGSYDGRKWACLGHREKSGEFRDIGTLVERTDCRFFRFILAGQVSKDSRLDYFEVSSRQSKLSTKIR